MRLNHTFNQKCRLQAFFLRITVILVIDSTLILMTVIINTSLLILEYRQLDISCKQLGEERLPLKALRFSLRVKMVDPYFITCKQFFQKFFPFNKHLFSAVD